MIRLKPETALGVDINERVISAVELKSERGAPGEKGKLKVRRSGTVPTPENTMSRGAVTDPKSIARALETLFKKNRMSARGKRVVASLAGSCCVARLTSLPKGGPDAVRQHIEQEIKRYAVFTGERTVSDFVVTGSAGEAAEGKAAYLAATREESADALVNALMNVGVDPVAVDIAPLATIRALHHGVHSPGLQSAVIFVVVEPGSVHLTVFAGGRLRFSHTAHEEVDIFDGNPEGADRLGAIVRTVLDFYDTEIGNISEIEKVVIATDHDLPQSACVRVRQVLDDVKVMFSSSASAVRDTGIDAGLDFESPTVCAVGLALRVFQNQRFRLNLNLLPAAAIRIKDFKKRVIITSIVAAGLLLVASLVFGGIHLWQRSLDGDIAGLEKKIEDVVLAPQLLKAGGGVAELEKILRKEKDFLESPGPAVPWPGLLEKIRQIIPEDVRITYLEEDGAGDLIIDGESYSIDSVYQFAEPFKSSEFMGSAKLSNLNEIEGRGDPMVGFSMDCELRSRKIEETE